ncbi:MAG TPA: hypothetical protein PK760_11300, partial [Flavobacteriales bacterium]|nr:hypothetical protein [Flavobacteriales bacterium]
MRSTLLATAFITSASLCAQNAYLTNGFFPRFWKANADYVIAARVRNSAATALISFHVDWRWNNGPVQTGNWQSTTGITGNQYWAYTNQINFNEPESAGTLKVWVVGSGDTDHTNDTLYYTVGVVPNWTAKSVLLEQKTGTWCQFCPPSDAICNTMDADPLIVVASHHDNDPFSSA